MIKNNNTISQILIQVYIFIGMMALSIIYCSTTTSILQIIFYAITPILLTVYVFYTIRTIEVPSKINFIIKLSANISLYFMYFLLLSVKMLNDIPVLTIIAFTLILITLCTLVIPYFIIETKTEYNKDIAYNYIHFIFNIFHVIIISILTILLILESFNYNIITVLPIALIFLTFLYTLPLFGLVMLPLLDAIRLKLSNLKTPTISKVNNVTLELVIHGYILVHMYSVLDNTFFVVYQDYDPLRNKYKTFLAVALLIYISVCIVTEIFQKKSLFITKFIVSSSLFAIYTFIIISNFNEKGYPASNIIRYIPSIVIICTAVMSVIKLKKDLKLNYNHTCSEFSIYQLIINVINVVIIISCVYININSLAGHLTLENGGAIIMFALMLSGLAGFGISIVLKLNTLFQKNFTFYVI